MPSRFSGLWSKLPWPGRARETLGVDIGADAVKLLRWPASPESPPDYAIAPLPQGAVVNQGIRDVAAVGRSIAEALGRLSKPSRDAVTAVPAALVMQRKLDVDTSLPEAELEALVLLEAERHVPWPLDEVRIDFCRLGQEDRGAGSVLLTVCRREHVEPREQALAQAGLRPIAVDVEHHAMERVLATLPATFTAMVPASQSRGPVAIADIGAAALCLHVFADGRSIHCESRPFAGGGEPPAKGQMLASQIAQALQVFHSSSRHGRVAQLYLGGAAANEALAEQAGQGLKLSLGLPVQVANPFAPFAQAGNETGTAIAKDGPALLLAAGLAIPTGAAYAAAAEPSARRSEHG